MPFRAFPARALVATAALASLCASAAAHAAAEAVHGLSDAFLSDKPRFSAHVDELLEFIGDSPLVAHNAGFDFGFLDAELALCARDPVCRSRMIDTVALARVRHPGAKLSLDALCSRYGIDRSHRTMHGALLDAELLAQVYVELTGGRQIGLELAGESHDALLASVVTTIRQRVFRPARPHLASEAELAAHTKFMESVKAPAWYA